MNVKDLFKKAFPHAAAIVIFLIIGAIYFQPALEGKQLRKGDTLNALGYKKEIMDYRKTTGDDPLWTNSQFGGMPAYQITVKYKASTILSKVQKTLELKTPSPIRWLFLYLIGFYILMITLGINPWLSIGGSLAFGFSTYFLIIIGAGHIWKVDALAFMPPALAGILLCFRGRYKTGGLLAALFLMMELYANHIQMTYYFMLTVIFITLFEGLHQYRQNQLPRFFKALGVIAMASLLALMVNVTNLYNTYQYGKESIRGKSELTLGDKQNKTTGLDKDYATGWSYGIQETLTLLIPNAKGGAGSPQEGLSILNYMQNGQIQGVADYYSMDQVKNSHYWGNQPFTAGPVYVGAIILFLFILGLFIVSGPLRWGLLTASILAILLSWGHNFMGLTNFFMDYVPLYNKFRVVSSILVIVELCVPILALLAMKKICDEPLILKQKINVGKTKVNITVIPLILTAGVSLVLLAIPDFFMDFISQQELLTLNNYRASNPQAISYLSDFQNDLQNARISIFRADALRSLTFILLAAITLWAWSKKMIKKPLLIGAIVVLIIADLWPINKRYLNDNNFVPKKELKVAFPPSRGDYMILNSELKNRPELQAKINKAIKDYKTENRRASKLELSIIPFSILNSNSDYRVMNMAVNTFNNASTSYLHKSIGGYHGAKLRRYQELIEHHISKNNTSVLNMLNTRYLILPNKEKGTTAQVNSDALGNVWLIKNIKLVDNADQELEALNNFDPATEAVVDKRFEKEVQNFVTPNDTTASIKQTHYAPNALSYRFASNQDQIAVFSEIYYDKGWNAYVDGKKMPHFRVNYVLRGMRIPSGTHNIEFKFEPSSFYICEKISLSAMILFALMCIGALGWTLRNRTINKTQE